MYNKTSCCVLQYEGTTIERTAQIDELLQRLNSVNSGIILRDRTGIGILANKFMCHELGDSLSNIVGKPIEPLLNRIKQKNINIIEYKPVINHELLHSRYFPDLINSVIKINLQSRISIDNHERCADTSTLSNLNSIRKLQYRSSDKNIYKRIVERYGIGCVIIYRREIIYTSELAKKTLGYSKDESIATLPIDLISLTPEGDRENIIFEINNFLHYKIEQFQIGKPVRTKAGDYINCDIRFLIDYNSDNMPEKIIITFKQVDPSQNSQDTPLNNSNSDVKCSVQDLKANYYELKSMFKDNYQDSLALLHLNDKLMDKKIELENQIDNLTRLVSEKETICSEMKIQVAESEKLKTAFVSNMNHEVKTPLNEIIVAADMLCFDNIDSNDRNEIKSNLKKSCYRLIQNVNEILEISKLDAGVVETELKSFNPGLILLEHYEGYTEILSAEKELSIRYELPDNWEEMQIISDESKIYQILDIFLNNAVKFSDKGIIGISLEHIDNSIIYSVKDNGIGIAEDAKPLIFKRFYQEDSQISRKYEGNGLGLAIALGLCELIGAEITFESQKHKGSIFNLKIPLKHS